LILPFFLHILSTLRVLFVDFIGVWDSLMVLNIIYQHQVGSCFKKWAKSGVPLQTSSSWFVRHRSTRHVTHSQHLNFGILRFLSSALLY
jgi:hypothetical protein